MRTLWRLWVIFLVFVTAGSATAQQPEKDDGRFFFFKDGDTIVVMGDSITEQHLYSNYLEMWSVARFPKRNLTFRNVGIGGDTSGGGNGRFKRDVLAHKATVLTVDFGMNDGRYQWVGQQRKDKTVTSADVESVFDVYMKGMQGIADQAKAAKIRVAWITPQPLEYKEPGPIHAGYNLTLERFSEGVEEIAKKNGGLFVDQFHPYMAVLVKARSTDPKNTYIMQGDAVHPGPCGQAVMASSILKRLDFQKLVSKVVIEIDPATRGQGAKLQAENCEAKLMSTGKEDGALVFTRLDFALPFFPEDAKGILKWAPILDEMNEYMLQIKGLPSGKYAIELDKAKIAELSAADLAKGVNLAGPALAAGPVADHVKEVWKAVTDKNRYFHDQIFRGVLLANAKSPIFKGAEGKDLEAKRQEVYAERMQKMPELDAAVRKAVQPREHTVRIAPMTK